MRALLLAVVALAVCATVADAKPGRPRLHRPRKGVLELCLARAAVSPPLKLMVTLTVNRRGRVSRATLPTGSLPSAATEACVLGEFRRLRFPRRRPRQIVVPFVYVGAAGRA